MRTRPDHQGSTLRRTFLHGRENNPHLLQTGLLRAPGQARKREILPVGGSGGSSRISALPEVPTRNCSILSGLERFAYNSGASAPADNGRGA
jgi:hypothetical protein